MKTNFFSISLFSLLVGFLLLGPARAINPPGTVKITDRFFADKTEVTNLNWREYLSWLKVNHGQQSEAYQKAYPDTSVWQETAPQFMGKYYQHPAFDKYPVVGISYEQAQAYCRWRTQVVQEMYAANYAPKQWIHLKNLVYRLPTVTEWQLIARLNQDRVLALERWEKDPGKFLFNFRQPPEGYRPPKLPYATLHDAIFAAPVEAYLPGELNIYNLYGNVAEMVSTPQVAMGGSWFQTEREVFSQPYLNYERPTNWLGFRCVCSIPPSSTSQF